MKTHENDRATTTPAAAHSAPLSDQADPVAEYIGAFTGLIRELKEAERKHRLGDWERRVYEWNEPYLAVLRNELRKTTQCVRQFAGVTSEGLPCSFVAEYRRGSLLPSRLSGCYYSCDGLDEYGQRVPIPFSVSSEFDLPHVVWDGDWRPVGPA